MNKFARLPAIPLITQDPLVSVWMPSDLMTGPVTTHWCGHKKPLKGNFVIDGKRAMFLSTSGGYDCAELLEQTVTPLSTAWTMRFGGVVAKIKFTSPFTPDDLDLASMPITLVSIVLESEDGKAHEVQTDLKLFDSLCHNGSYKDAQPKLVKTVMQDGDINVGIFGQADQRPVSMSGDNVSMDWGYLLLYSRSGITFDGRSANFTDSRTVQAREELQFVIAYEDIASINYFGTLCKPYFTRTGNTTAAAAKDALIRFDALMKKCDGWDERILQDARDADTEGYEAVVCASWRQTWSAHKLIVTPSGAPALLSKENDSNGCIGTVDVSYPSIPIFLKYCPELVNAMCLPVLEFADMPVWEYDFAPHDVGRYPQATGQVYGRKSTHSTEIGRGESHLPYYLYPATDLYDFHLQMPVEECGNMLIMMYAATRYGASDALCKKYRPHLDKWVKYLLEYGEDPGEQLCTDDFAGHLAHNVNLAFKAVVGIAAYAHIIGDMSYLEKAKEMSKTILARIGDQGNTPLTLTGEGWSMKYNLLWDKLFGFGLFSEEFYKNEIASYLPKINQYGLPLDSRSARTKSDWLCWIAAMADDKAARDALIKPLARYLEETQTRVPFSDLYDTKTGDYIAFIARSVQGGIFALMLR
ncbi:MAG: DUF4965 domain-containing protein [Clostridia bacterium]|nr:DUF4965 domain-containing protein [Clostridia bacterium]